MHKLWKSSNVLIWKMLLEFRPGHEMNWILARLAADWHTLGCISFVLKGPIPIKTSQKLIDKNLFFRVHVVFGLVISGFEVVKKIEGLKTDSASRPYADVRVVDCGQLITKSANDGSFQDRLSLPFSCPNHLFGAYYVVFAFVSVLDHIAYFGHVFN